MSVLSTNLQRRSWVIGALAAGVALLLITPPLADRFFGNGDGRFGFYSLDTLIPTIIGTLCAAIVALLLLSDTWLKNLAAMLIGLFFCFFVLEIFLRIYDPFQFRFHLKEISLPHNVKYIIRNEKISKCDSVIIHTKNSLGFRGADYPARPDSYYKIIFVGGSTTECFHISDGNDWPSLTGAMLQHQSSRIWHNNAGLDGHSTFGHLVLVHDLLLPLHPQMIVFLIGWNDIGNRTKNEYDVDGVLEKHRSWQFVFMKYSKTASLIDSMCRFFKTMTRIGARHTEQLFAQGPFIDIDEREVERALQDHADNYIPGFRQRIGALCALCRSNGIEPVFVTQPAFIGEGLDSLTGADRGRLQLKNKVNGKMYWRILELYNRAMLDNARNCGAATIDLAHLLPKKSEYFYDIGHFSNRGSQAVAALMFAQLAPLVTQSQPHNHY